MKTKTLRHCATRFSVWLPMLIILLTSAIWCGCKTHERVVEVEVPVETVRTEYRDRMVQRTDSIWLRDSIYIDRSRDTLLIERWHTQNVLKMMRDTVTLCKTDSIAVPVYIKKAEVRTVKVEKPQSWWQSALKWLGGVALAAIALYIGYHSLKRWLRTKIPKI